MNDYEPYEPYEGGGKKAKRIIVFILGLILAVGITLWLYVQGALGGIRRTETRPEDVVAAEDETFQTDGEDVGPDTLSPDSMSFDLDSIELMKSDDVKNLLLIGQDARSGQERQRSDSMIICSINTKEDRITLVSLMRDMYVPIPGYSDNRINAAYVFGGMELLDSVVEQDFGVHIDGNVEVDFDGFINAMGVLGNLDIELTEEEAYYMNNHDWTEQGEGSTGWNLTAGMNSLTPQQVLAYSRMRYVGNSDYDRTERQRKVIMTAFKKASEGGLISMLGLAKQITPYLTTDLSTGEMLSYMGTIATKKISTTESYRIPVDGTYSGETIQGMSVLVPDLAANSQYLQEYIYGES